MEALEENKETTSIVDLLHPVQMLYNVCMGKLDSMIKNVEENRINNDVLHYQDGESRTLPDVREEYEKCKDFVYWFEKYYKPIVYGKGK